MKQYGVVMVATTELIVTVVVFIYAGMFIDKQFHSSQVGIITGSVIGAILAFTRFIIRLQKINQDDDRKNNP